MTESVHAASAPDATPSSAAEPLDSRAAQVPANLQTYVTPGMPPLAYRKHRVSLFEFWPLWAMYLPVVLQWLLLSVRYRSLTLPLLANPKLPLSGMVGVAKSLLFRQATGLCREAILDWFTYQISADSAQQQAEQLLVKIKQQGFSLPLVCKPDIGCRGSGVKLVKNEQQLQQCLAAYPVGANVMIQVLSRHEPEAGIFYVREPGSRQGKIVSMALKYMPYVVGNGRDTLGQLITQDERAGDLAHLYRERHQHAWDHIVPEGEPYRLVFSASHSKGAIFKDANHCVTPELTEAINSILADLPEFYYGRLDVKFPSIEQLQAGRGIDIIEINTASSESLHIWDSDTPLREAYRALLFQYRTLFRLGHINRQRGFKTPGLRLLLKHWRAEKQLQQYYPATD